MLTDPGYRARVIDSVRRSGSEELRGLAEEAARYNVGKVAESPVSWDAAGRTELDIEELITDTGPQARRGPSRMSVVGTATAVLLFAIAGGVLSYLFSEPLAALIAGRERVSGEITEATTWPGDRTYVLEDKVFVTAGATLTIERGARILGEPGSALVIARSGNLQAQGSRDAPIVFTSASPEGERARGDWGGVVLLGSAPVNVDDPHIEGIPTDDPRGDFGGGDPAGSCGVMKYARIEFAGHEIAANVELNGLTLGGCGSATVVRNVQVHKGLDDGVEVFGGTVNLSRIVITRAADDGLDWDLGWTGNAQFVVIQQEGKEGDNAIEADNNRDNHYAQPRSSPTIGNMTLIGSRRAGAGQHAMTLRRGTAADLRNLVIAGFPAGVVDIRDRSTAGLVPAGRLRIAGAIAHEIGPDGETWARREVGNADDDGGFDEAAWLADTDIGLGTDPLLPRAAYDLRAPRFAPGAGSPAASGAAALPPAEFWDTGARFLGAVEPGAAGSWLDGWTAFPER